MRVSFETRKVTAKAVAPKQAAALVAQYRESGLGSNRTDWARTVVLLSAVLHAIETGYAIDVTELFPATGSGKQYHIAHRALGSGVLRPFWKNVTVVVIKDATVKGTSVTGESTTTGKGVVLIAPTL
jgi:phytoene dehydrogenase-like protein